MMNLEAIGSRAIAALRAAIPDTDDKESVAFRNALEKMTAALASGGVRTPVIDAALRNAMDAYAGMPAMDSVPNMLSMEQGRQALMLASEVESIAQRNSQLADQERGFLMDAAGKLREMDHQLDPQNRLSIAEQIREVKNQIAGEGSLQIVVALQDELDDAALELGIHGLTPERIDAVAAPYLTHGVFGDMPNHAARLRDFARDIENEVFSVMPAFSKVLPPLSDRKVSGMFLASLGDPVEDANELVGALRKVIPDRDPEVTAFRSALESMTSRLYASGVGGAVIGPALGDALEVYVAIAASPQMKTIGVDVEGAEPVRGYVLAFPGASDAEAEELVETLKGGGNTVFRVEGAVADEALRSALEQAGLEPGDLQP